MTGEDEWYVICVAKGPKKAVRGRIPALARFTEQFLLTSDEMRRLKKIAEEGLPLHTTMTLVGWIIPNEPGVRGVEKKIPDRTLVRVEVES